LLYYRRWGSKRKQKKKDFIPGEVDVPQERAPEKQGNQEKRGGPNGFPCKGQEQ